MRRAILLCGVLACGCGKDGGGDESGGSTGGTDSFTSGHSLSSSDPSAVSLTFTNTSDDPSSDPTTDPSGDPTTDPSTDPDSEGSGETRGESSSGSGESTAPGESSSDAGASSSDGGTPGGACCEAQDEPGCADGDVEACVCARDSACCDIAWDTFCTVQVVLLGCDVCPGIGGDGDCCAAHDNPGCDDDMVEACVCEQDFVCCTEAWDDVCVDEAAGCGAC